MENDPVVINSQHKSGWWLQPTPLKNMSSSVGIMKFPRYGTNNPSVQNHQAVILELSWVNITQSIPIPQFATYSYASHRPCSSMIYLSYNTVIFHSYVKLPQSTPELDVYSSCFQLNGWERTKKFQVGISSWCSHEIRN